MSVRTGVSADRIDASPGPDGDATPQAVAIVGPTASGKSAVAMAVAESIPAVELVSIDSMQVYRGMNIGTATPTAQERGRVPHHLIDIVDPAAEFSVTDFAAAYAAALVDIRRRDHIPLLVGGTGLYHRVVIDRLVPPGRWPDVGAALEAEAATSGPEALHARLSTLDPAAASKIEPTNTRRIIRALEVCVGSGRPFSSFGPGLDHYPASPVVQIGLRWPRERLSARIAQRVNAMMDLGLLDEVRTLAQGTLSKTARQALGYKELLAYLDGETGLAEAVDAIVTRTRQFAVRQERWFRRDPRIQWVDIDDDPVAAAAPVVSAVLDRIRRS